METTKTTQKSIRSEIDTNIKENGYTLSKLGKLSCVNPGHLSENLNSNPPRAITTGSLNEYYQGRVVDSNHVNVKYSYKEYSSKKSRDL
ncbi:hypothetical protein [Brevibacillus sp. DP1.3A]|uniref:hypothetical protein n=1 Tax=Brevibacillus sp. DP1.3A TaxID=2738867 RepID=UPI00156BBE9F